MSIAIHLIIANPTRLQWLQSVLANDAEFVVVSAEPDILLQPLPVQLYIVDLGHPFAARPDFWIGAHIANPKASLMALVDLNTVTERVLQTALQAGAGCLVDWNEPPEQVRIGVRVATSPEASEMGVRLMTSAKAIARVLGNPRPAHLDCPRSTEKLCSTEKLWVDPCSRKVFLKDQPIRLRPREFDVLSYLAHHPDQIVPKLELLRAIWRVRAVTKVQRQRIKTVVSRIRSKIEPDPGQPQFLLSEYGRGYKVPADKVQTIQLGFGR